MKRKLFAGVAVLFFIMQTSAFAITGQQVFDKYRQTEKKAEKALKSMIMVVEMKSADASTETTIYKKGKKMRVESVIKESTNPMFAKPGDKNISIDDGVTTTIFSPMMGKISTPSEQAEEENRRTSNVAYLGEETVSEIKCHKIKATYRDGETETLWISAKDYVLVKETDDEGISIINSDFRKVKGLPMPYLSRTYESGAVEETTTIKSIKVGARIPDSKFDPSKVKGFKTAGTSGSESAAPAMDAANKAMMMMQMGMEIQRLHMNGETEKAKALEMKLQKMAEGQ